MGAEQVFDAFEQECTSGDASGSRCRLSEETGGTTRPRRFRRRGCARRRRGDHRRRSPLHLWRVVRSTGAEKISIGLSLGKFKFSDSCVRLFQRLFQHQRSLHQQVRGIRLTVDCTPDHHIGLRYFACSMDLDQLVEKTFK